VRSFFILAVQPLVADLPVEGSLVLERQGGNAGRSNGLSLVGERRLPQRVGLLYSRCQFSSYQRYKILNTCIKLLLARLLRTCGAQLHCCDGPSTLVGVNRTATLAQGLWLMLECACHKVFAL
jgi:hypothetical protein